MKAYFTKKDTKLERQTIPVKGVSYDNRNKYMKQSTQATLQHIKQQYHKLETLEQTSGGRESNQGLVGGRKRKPRKLKDAFSDLDLDELLRPELKDSQRVKKCEIARVGNKQPELVMFEEFLSDSSSDSNMSNCQNQKHSDCCFDQKVLGYNKDNQLQQKESRTDQPLEYFPVIERHRNIEEDPEVPLTPFSQSSICSLAAEMIERQSNVKDLGEGSTTDEAIFSSISRIFHQSNPDQQEEGQRATDMELGGLYGPHVLYNRGPLERNGLGISVRSTSPRRLHLKERGRNFTRSTSHRKMKLKILNKFD